MYVLAVCGCVTMSVPTEVCFRRTCLEDNPTPSFGTSTPHQWGYVSIALGPVRVSDSVSVKVLVRVTVKVRVSCVEVRVRMSSVCVFVGLV